VSAITRVRLPRFPVRRAHAPRPRTLLAAALIVVLLGGGWLWLRGSSLVGVHHVTVTGVNGPGSSAIRSALEGAGRSMTTLEVNMAALRAAVAPFPVVQTLRVSTQFPHGMRIQVVEHRPVGAVSAGGRRIAVAADGTLLPSVSPAGLPSIPVSVPPAGARVSTGAARGAVALLAAAPAWLRSRVTQVASTAAIGLVADLRNGPQIRFGAATELRAKWTAVATVLADSSSQGAAYIDVTVPGRPAAGGAVGAVSASSSGPTAGTMNAAASPAAGAAASPAIGATGVAASPATGATGAASPAATTGANGVAGGSTSPPVPATTGG
jgi:cell division protein FtsQ